MARSKQSYIEAGARGGLALRNKFVQQYEKNPNRCIYCNEVIRIEDGRKPSSIASKKFCNHSCAAKYNNLGRHRATPQKSLKLQKSLKINGVFGDKTKLQVFQEAVHSWLAHGRIRKHARSVFAKSGRPYACVVCGYDKHVNISHIKKVSAFGPESLISEINSINNLEALCPNHHWERDNL